MKKLFGGIDLTWKKLIIFSIIVAIYTAIMAILPITDNTSFRDIAIQFEWWILFGIIIISNSKSPTDSALKCFVFFLISQPLIYLIQVPFSHLGWLIFMYYRYWFMWTLLCLPMGYIGYYIKKNNILSVIILLPMLVFLSYLGFSYLNAAFDSFPQHLLSCILCFLFIIIIVLNIFDKLKLRIISFILTIITIVVFSILNDGIVNPNYEVVRSLGQYEIKVSGEPYISAFYSTKAGKVELISYDDTYNIKLIGKKGGNYEFKITDDVNTYYFKYYFDKKENTVVLEKIDE